MSERVEHLRAVLDDILQEWMFGDEGITLTRPTNAQRKEVQEIAKQMPLTDVVQAVSYVCANALTEELLRRGLRPADYWGQQELMATLLKRVGAELTKADSSAVAAMQTTIRGQG